MTSHDLIIRYHMLLLYGVIILAKLVFTISKWNFAQILPNFIFSLFNCIFYQISISVLKKSIFSLFFKESPIRQAKIALSYIYFFGCFFFKKKTEGYKCSYKEPIGYNVILKGIKFELYVSHLWLKQKKKILLNVNKLVAILF